MNYMTAEEIAAELRVDISTVRRWIRSGQLRAIKAGRQFRITRSAYDQFLKSREVTQDQDPKDDGLAALATRPTFAAAL